MTLGPVLITGIHGFIGKHAATRILSEGHTVRGLGRRAEPIDGVELVVGDIADREVAREAMRGVRTVLHFAAYFGDEFEEAKRVNVEGTRVVAEAALEAGCERFVHFSTCGVYALDGLEVVDRDTPLWPFDEGTPLVYGVSKAEGERALIEVADRGLAVVVLRLPNVLGADFLNAWAYHLPVAIRDGRFKLGGDGEHTWPYVHLQNLLDVTVLVMTEPTAAGNAYTVLDGHVTYGEFVGTFASWLGVDIQRREPTWPYDHFRGRFATDELASIGHRPRRTYADAMAETQSFLRDNGIIA